MSNVDFDIANFATNTEKELRDYNIPIYGTYGEFSLSPSVRVPYIVALMDLKRLTLELKTHEEVSPSLDSTYTLTELFQREIDIERVQAEIVDRYLKDPAKLKFFNALTFVLLPKDESGKLQSKFEDYPNNDPDIPLPQDKFDQFFANPAWKRTVFGGVQFVKTETAGLSRLRWDKRRVDVVAVDGQHRLRALKEWMRKKNNELVEIEKPTRVPVIFLLLHEKAGFSQAGSSQQGIKTIAREIFTDLNKNAKEVDLATQIILDDRSIESLCVRSLVTEGTCEDSPPLLPLTLVRWQEANNRFDQRYFLNSLVHLYSVISDLLDLRPPTKIDKADGLQFVRSAEALLGEGNPPRLIHNGKNLVDFYIEGYTENDEAVAPITGIPPSFLASAVNGFNNRFSKWLLRLLTEFRPYRQVLDYARASNLISGEFGQYLSQPKSHQIQLREELAARHGEEWYSKVIGTHERNIQFIKGSGRAESEGGEYWAFKAIFQKAFIKLGKIIFFDTPEADRARMGTVEEFIEFFDDLHERGVLSVLAKFNDESHKHFVWTFISVNFGNKKIQVANTAEKRMLATLALWYFAKRLAISEKKVITEKRSAPEETDAAELLDKLDKVSANSQWPNIQSYISELKNIFIAWHEQIDPSCADRESKKAKTNAKERLIALLATGLVSPQVAKTAATQV